MLPDFGIRREKWCKLSKMIKWRGNATLSLSPKNGINGIEIEQ
jgi:hypothetical protein